MSAKDINNNSGDTQKQLRNLRKLLEINSLINVTLDMGKLLNIIMEIIKDIMDAEASTLFLYEESSKDLVFKVALGEAGKELTEKQRIKIGQGIAGWVAEKKKGIYINNVYSDARFDPNYDKITGFNSRAILCVPLLFKGKFLGVIQAINPINKVEFDDNDLSLFISFADQVVLAVQNAIFFQNAIEEQRIKDEITSAQSFHKSLLPAIDKKYFNIHIAANSIPAMELGGVFYDVLYFDNGYIGITIGDSHKKGISGALNASMLLGAVKGVSSAIRDNPSKLLKLLTNAVNINIKSISVFYGLISCERKTIQFANAGFAYPILIRNNVARYLKFSFNPDEANSMPRRINVVLQPNDFFVIITDGILNLKNRGAQNLGLKRVMDNLSGNFNTPVEIINSLNKLAEDFLDGLDKREDISIIAFKLEEKEK